MKFELQGGQSKGRSIDFNGTIRKNVYLEISKSPNSRSPTALIGRPGLKLETTLTPDSGSGGRGEYTTPNNRWFIVVGNTLFERDGLGNNTNRGNLNTTFGTVKMVSNGIDLTIVDGTNGYNFKLATNTLLVINTTNFPSSGGFPNNTTHIVFIDQRLIAFDPTTINYFWSGVTNAETWSSLDKGVAEYSPDHTTAIDVLKGNLWIFCTDTAETHYNTGNLTNTFIRRPGAVQDFGCAAKYSPAKLNNSIFWLGSNKDGNRVIFKTVGFNVKKISDHDIEFELGQIDDVSDAIGFTYQQEGHFFYQLTFLAGKKTLTWDESSEEWHERTYFNDMGVEVQSIEIYHTLFNSKNYVLSRGDGNVYEYDLDTYSDNGQEIIKEFTLPLIHSEQEFIYFKRIQIDMETGVGLVVGQGSDPQMGISWADDGDADYGNDELVSIGKLGDKSARAYLDRLGRARNRRFKCRISDPIKVHIFSAIVKV